MIELVASEIPDIRLDVNQVERSVVFPIPLRIPSRPNPSHMTLLNQLKLAVDERRTQIRKKSFSIALTEELTYRVQRVSDNVYSLRLCLSKCLSLDSLGISKGYAERLMSPALKKSGGLVLISGLPGSGKTTTLAGVISDRLKTLGGFAVSIEDPIEMPLAGFQGEKGYCEQMELGDEDSFYEKIVDSLRCFPSGDTSMLALGEIRENEAAAELLRIGIDGHLVFSTIHAKGPIEALHRVLTMAAQGGEQSAKTLLANSLKLVVHQEMVNNKPRLSALEVNDKVKATILNGNVNALIDEVRATDMKLRGIDAPAIR